MELLYSISEFFVDGLSKLTFVLIYVDRIHLFIVKGTCFVSLISCVTRRRWFYFGGRIEELTLMQHYSEVERAAFFHLLMVATFSITVLVCSLSDIVSDARNWLNTIISVMSPPTINIVVFCARGNRYYGYFMPQILTTGWRERRITFSYKSTKLDSEFFVPYVENEVQYFNTHWYLLLSSTKLRKLNVSNSKM